jgi:probable rRNA maturation factor
MPPPVPQSANPDPDPEPNICGWLAVDLADDAGDWSQISGAEAAITLALTAMAVHPAMAAKQPSDVCIALSNDASVRRLNATYRSKDKPTNVLSFPAGDEAQEPGAARLFLGDVVLALETVLREAAELGIPPAHHLQHLAVHGVLHLNGYDHVSSADAEIMEALEIEILSDLGLANPYGSGQILEPALDT